MEDQKLEFLDTDSILIQYLIKTQALEEILLDKGIITKHQLANKYEQVEQNMMKVVNNMMEKFKKEDDIL